MGHIKRKNMMKTELFVKQKSVQTLWLEWKKCGCTHWGMVRSKSS